MRKRTNNPKRFGGWMAATYQDHLLERAFPLHAEAYACLYALLHEYFGSPRQPYLIVEGGCGTGLSTKVILEAALSAQVAAVDSEPAMLAQAKERLAGQERLTLVEQDILVYLQTLPNESVKAFVSAFTLHNTPPEYRAAVIAEVYRVLCPRGHYHNLDKVAQDDLRKHRRDLLRQLLGFWVYLVAGRLRVFAGLIRHYLEDEKIRFTESEQHELLLSNGFGSVEKIGRWHTECLVTATKPRA